MQGAQISLNNLGKEQNRKARTSLPRYRRRFESKNLARSKEVRSGSKMKASRLRPAAFQRRCPAVSWTKSCLSKKPHVLPDAQRDAGSLSHKMHNGQLYMELRSADKGENRISRGRKHGSHLGDTCGGATATSIANGKLKWQSHFGKRLGVSSGCRQRRHITHGAQVTPPPPHTETRT